MKTLTQKEKLLELLQENGTIGINSFGIARELALQLPARIWDLKQDGHQITSITKDDGSVDYILTGEYAKRINKQPVFKVVDGRYVAVI